MEIFKYFNDAISDSGLLYILVITDTILALTYNIKVKKSIMSNELLSGLMRNFMLSTIPLLIFWLSKFRPRSDDLYSIIASLFTILIGYGILESILAYLNLWGVKYPQWLLNILKGEINSKMKVEIDENGNTENSTTTSSRDNFIDNKKETTGSSQLPGQNQQGTNDTGEQ